MSSVIAIDLGTTSSCVSVWHNGKVNILKDLQGNTRIPTCVAFAGNERLIGNAAKGQASDNPKNTIVDAKRLIGRPFDDPKIQGDIKMWPFKLVNGAGKPKIEVQPLGETKQLDPEEIISMVLKNMREIADYNLRTKVTKAVITVPSVFNEAQRRATLAAGTKAGLEVLRLVNNPSAVALAYGLVTKIKNEKNILVFDLGGGTLDVSVVLIADGGLVEVKSTAGDTYLGGQDFDSRLVQYFCNKFTSQYDKNLFNDARAMRRLRTAAERAKCILSSKNETFVEIKALYQRQDFKIKITRSRFEELCADLFKSTLKSVERALKDAGMSKHAINDVVVVGGSSKIPKIRNLLRDFFEGKKLNASLGGVSTVAYGAAIQAAVLGGGNEMSSAIKDALLLEVTPISIGVEGPENMMKNIIHRNSGIPWKTRRQFTTKHDNQRKLMIQIFEGEYSLAAENNLMRSLEISGIRPARKGVPKIELQFELDVNGLLGISVVQPAHGHAYNLIESSAHDPLKQAEAAELLSDDESDEEEETEDDRQSARQQLTSYVVEVKATAAKSRFSDAVRNQVTNLCDEVLRWIARNPNAKVHDYQYQIATLSAALPRWK